jgi:hypothetical protein
MDKEGVFPARMRPHARKKSVFFKTSYSLDPADLWILKSIFHRYAALQADFRQQGGEEKVSNTTVARQ